MRNADYAVMLHGYDGALIASLSNFTQLEYARSFNTVGGLSVTVPGTVAGLRRNQRIVVRRAVQEGQFVQDMNTVWLLRTVRRDYDNDTTTLVCVDSLGLLKDRIIAWWGGDPQATKTDDNGASQPADDMLKAFVRENMGTLAPSFRRMPGLNVDPDTSSFPVASKDAPWRNLFDTLTEVSNETGDGERQLIFDLIPYADFRQLRFATFDTYSGADRRQSVRFGPLYGNLTEAKLEIEWADYATFAFVGGDGDDSDRLIAEIPAPWYGTGGPYDRVEIFVDARDELDDGVLQSEGYAALYASRARARLSGTAVPTLGCVYGVDFFYGDNVHVDTGDVSFDAVINSVSVRVEPNSEEVSVTLSSDYAIYGTPPRKIDVNYLGYIVRFGALMKAVTLTDEAIVMTGTGV